MKKALFVLVFSMASHALQAETVRLSATDSIQEGIRFKNLGKCLFVQESREEDTANAIAVELVRDDFGNAKGQWSKEVSIGFKKVEYRVTASRRAGAGNELQVSAEILVNGEVESGGIVDLDDTSLAPRSFVDVVVAYDDAYCYSANLEVTKPILQDLKLTMSEQRGK